jgi:hypothetical protein
MRRVSEVEHMLEYGKAYMEANDRIIDAMKSRMSDGAIALAYRMANEANEAEAEEFSEELTAA